MRIGMMLAEPPGGSTDELVGSMRTAADAGLSSVWVTDPIWGIDGLALLGMAAREVPDIEVGTAVMPAYFRHPVTAAREAITIDIATGGRFALGLGVSHESMIDGMMHLSYEKPVRYLREYLEIVTPLLRDGKVSYSGETMSADVELTVRPVGPLPVLLAAMGPQMLKLAGSQADGTIVWLTGPKTLESHVVPRITEAAEEAGRPKPRVMCMLPVGITDNPAGAREITSQVLSLYSTLPAYRAMLDREGAAGPGDVAIYGSPDQVRDEIEALAAIGVTDFLAAVFAPPPANEATLALLGELATLG